MARFSDIQLIQILQKAGRRINRRLCLFDTADEITVDSGGNITSPANDGALEDFVLMQAECMIAQRGAQEALIDGTDGVHIVDGEQTMDTRASAIARGTFFNSAHSPCGELEAQLKIEKLNRLMSGAGGGKAIW